MTLQTPLLEPMLLQAAVEQQERPEEHPAPAERRPVAVEASPAMAAHPWAAQAALPARAAQAAPGEAAAEAAALEVRG